LSEISGTRVEHWRAGGKGGYPGGETSAHKESKAEDWQLAIHEAREGAIGVFTDASMDKKGGVGGVVN